VSIDRSRVSFGIKTSQSNLTYDEILRTWREADEVPVFEHAWLWDHMIPLRGDTSGAALEAWTLLAALAAQTHRLRLGIIVTSNRLRPPPVLVKMAATVDIIAGGRLVFGIGAGGSAVSDPAAAAMVHRLPARSQRHQPRDRLYVLTLTGDRICAMSRLENSVLPSFGLPRSLPSP
jgi:alkanesulfonate monooxygenase SsuD/methylene tetrahydromethanopterin reductase-like flavin-dependent oxidoreductase (luciferase family)